jgi:hypothetical protein
VATGKEWTINGVERTKADEGCQPIMVNKDACATCPLAVKAPEEPPSEYLQRLLYLDGLQQAGAQIPFDYLTMVEWEGLALLKRKRDDKQIKDLKAKRK